MTTIAENLKTLKDTLPEDVTLIAVSKTKPIEDIRRAYDTGHRNFGENKVQEMVEKADQLPPDIQWHMIGHLQRNKVKYMAGFVYLIHGVDSLRLLREINKQAAKNNRVQKVLLQIHIAEESTKFGLSDEEFREIIQPSMLSELEHIEIAGLMGMATLTEDRDQIRKEFTHLSELSYELHSHIQTADILSMGMSGDYEIALECGSNMIRIGTAIFGSRTPQSN
jgi:pyridoxal phosphate enzyme (YggS family)